MKAKIEEMERFLLFLMCSQDNIFLLDKDSNWTVITTRDVYCQQQNYFQMDSNQYNWYEIRVIVLASKSGAYYDGGNAMTLRPTDMWRVARIDLADVTAYLGGSFVSRQLLELLKK